MQELKLLNAKIVFVRKCPPKWSKYWEWVIYTVFIMNGNQNQYGTIISKTEEHLVKKEKEQFLLFKEQKEQCYILWKQL